MIRLALTMALAGASAASQDAAVSVPLPPCHTSSGVAIGCIGNDQSDAPENAADLSEKYGNDSALIQKASSYLHRFDCLVISDAARKIEFIPSARLVVATEAGDRTVFFVQLSGLSDPGKRPVLWVAARYLKPPCPPPAMPREPARDL